MNKQLKKAISAKYKEYIAAYNLRLTMIANYIEHPDYDKALLQQNTLVLQLQNDLRKLCTNNETIIYLENLRKEME